LKSLTKSVSASSALRSTGGTSAFGLSSTVEPYRRTTIAAADALPAIRHCEAPHKSTLIPEGSRQLRCRYSVVGYRDPRQCSAVRVYDNRHCIFMLTMNEEADSHAFRDVLGFLEYSCSCSSCMQDTKYLVCFIVWIKIHQLVVTIIIINIPSIYYGFLFLYKYIILFYVYSI